MITINNLSKNYGNVEAVKSISFKINDGEIVGFLGANGAGKSTTLKMITGYLNPTSGSVDINGLSLEKNSYEIRKMIGYLPEHNPLYLDMKVYDMLSFTSQIRGMSNTKFKDALDKVINQCGLQGVIHKHIFECSKGYRQRIGLANTILHDPKILILDEPVTGLDPNQIIEIRQLIKALGKEKLVLMSSHILQEIEATVDKLVVIHNGRIVADGIYGDLLNQSDTDRKLNLVIKGTVDDKDITNKITKQYPDLVLDSFNQELDQARFVFNCASKIDPREDLFKFTIKSKWNILELNFLKVDLEHVFRKLTEDKTDA